MSRALESSGWRNPRRRPPSRSLLLAPFGVALVLFAGWVAVLAIPGAFLLAIFLFMPGAPATLVIAAIACGALVVWFWRRSWIAGCSMLIGLGVVLAMATVPDLGDSPASRVADWTQLLYYRGELRAMTRELRRQHVTPVVAVKSIDGFLSMSYGIAYDPTGEILLPVGQRSAAWRRAVRLTHLSSDCLGARRITGAYYKWNTGC